MEKTKFQIEFDLKSIPPALLWTYISSPSGLKEWFADEVTLHGKRFTFRWDDGAEQTAAIVAQRTESSLRLRPVDITAREPPHHPRMLTSLHRH